MRVLKISWIVLAGRAAESSLVRRLHIVGDLSWAGALRRECFSAGCQSRGLACVLEDGHWGFLSRHLRNNLAYKLICVSELVLRVLAILSDKGEAAVLDLRTSLHPLLVMHLLLNLAILAGHRDHRLGCRLCCPLHAYRVWLAHGRIAIVFPLRVIGQVDLVNRARHL